MMGSEYIHNVDRRGMLRVKEGHFLWVHLLWGEISKYGKKEEGGNLNRKGGQGCSCILESS